MGAYFSGEWNHIFSTSVRVEAPCSRAAKYRPMSLVCSMMIQLEMERWETAQTKRSVWPTIQLVMKPP